MNERGQKTLHQAPFPEAAPRAPAPEAAPQAGDVGLLVPVDATWRVLDLSGGSGTRGAVLANWARETICVASDPRQRSLLARFASKPGEGGLFAGMIAGRRLPFRVGSFDLIVLEEQSLWSLERVRPLLRPGGWLIWLREAEPPPSLSSDSLLHWLETLRDVRGWLARRLPAERRWQQELAAHKLDYCRAYIHVRGYSWGYLPFDATHIHRYYLESIKEDGVGAARGQAQIARLLGRVGLYRYLVSAYALVARAGTGGSPE